MLKGGGDLVHLDQVVKRLGEDSEDRFHRTPKSARASPIGTRLSLRRCMSYFLMLHGRNRSSK